jgi:hypothetical protein
MKAFLVFAALVDVSLCLNIGGRAAVGKNNAVADAATSGNSQGQRRSSAEIAVGHRSSTEIAVAVSLRGTDDVAQKSVAASNFKHTLRVCNAYPSDDDIEVYQGKAKITESSMAYKDCQEFPKTQLHSGEKLVFKVGSVTQGSFVVSDLPRKDAVLMLVIFRHRKDSKAAAFESHVFSSLVNAQIAVLDTYLGAAKAEPRIRDAKDSKTSRDEELRYDSVVAVNPGVYEVVLREGEESLTGREELVALNRESYLVLRVGAESEDADEAYPQELVVFPNSDKKILVGDSEDSGAMRVGSSALVAVLLLALGANVAA